METVPQWFRGAGRSFGRVEIIEALQPAWFNASSSGNYHEEADVEEVK
jgi:hypothetical protein